PESGGSRPAADGGRALPEEPMSGPLRSARLPRRPEAREAEDGEDDPRPGAWMIQSSPPQEQAEDPFGLQRPEDRDASVPAEELADALSELPAARLVAHPAPVREVLLADDPLPARACTHRLTGVP